MRFTISNSTVSSNETGILITPGNEVGDIGGVISNNTITQNTAGIWGSSIDTAVALTGNTISGGSLGVFSNAGLKSFGDNKITGNVTDVSGYFAQAAPR